MSLKKVLVLVAALAVVLCGVSVLQAEEGDLIVLWGKQTAGFGMTNAKVEGNKVTLDKTAEVVSVEGDASSYCIWSGGRSVLCGGPDRKKDIKGEKLGKGDYSVIPGLGKGQSVSNVTIRLKYAP